MRKILLSIMLAVIVTAAFSQTKVTSDVVKVKRGAASDTVVATDTIIDSYYVYNFSNELKVYHEMDTTSHTSNDTVEVGLQLSYNNSDWIEVDRDTVTISASHRVLQESTSKAPYWRTWIRGLTATNGATTKWKYNLLVDTNK